MFVTTQFSGASTQIPGNMVTMSLTSLVVLPQVCAQASAIRQTRTAFAPCTTPVRSLSCKSTFRGGSLAQHSRAHQRASQQRQRSNLVVQAGLGEVGKYLSEAAAAVFSPTKEDVPWSGGKHDYHPLVLVNRAEMPCSSCLIPQGASLAKCPTTKEMFHV